MYLRHFGLNEAPFRITPHTDFFFAGANRGATLEALLYAVAHDEGIVKVTGEVGSGKTMLCRVLMERLPGEVETIYLANPSVPREEILIAIADELKLDPGSERSTRVLRSLQHALVRLYAEGRRVVVLIDEAHAMPRETLEEIRLLSNLEANRHKLLQLVLFGQPELDEQLNSSQLRQLKERITHSFRLAPMQRSDIAAYIEFRLRAAGYCGPNPFADEAVRMIVEASHGLTRRINILADKSMLAAFAANTHSIGRREMKRAIEDCDFYRPERRSRRWAPAALAGAGGVAAGFALAWQFASGKPELPQASASLPAAAASTLTPAATVASRFTPLPAKPAQDAPQIVSAGKVAAAVPVAASAPPGGEGPSIPAQGKRVRERFLATQQWLQEAPGKHVALQLMTVKESDLARLESFLVRASRLVPQEALHVYSVKIDGAQHYRAAYGDFPGSSEALVETKQLPPLFSSLHPYLRSVARMQSQNRQ